MKTLRLGIVGTGLMGKEIASATARWCHLLDTPARLQVAGLCSPIPDAVGDAWFKDNFAGLKVFTRSLQEFVASPDLDVIYCAVPHNLHAEFYTTIISAGKHLLAEKPFGMDLAQNTAILDCLKKHPGVFVRCSSQFPFFPAVQRMGSMLDANEFGRIIEASGYFLHSSDLDPDKPINWKRLVECNGEYGCMGDLGMHVCHVPFRAGWKPLNVRAVLSKIVAERPDGKGGRVPCKTWDNATLLCETVDPVTNTTFPLTLKTQRIAPGEKNSWGVEIYGTKASARWCSRQPKRLETLVYAKGAEQCWQDVQMGYESVYKAVTGDIFEFGFSDAILQMLAAYAEELVNGKPRRRFAGCARPEETALSHRLFTAALESQRKASVEPL